MHRQQTILVAAAMLLAAGGCAAAEVFPVVHNQPIAVRILDGREGKPQARMHVVLVAGYDRSDLELGIWREEKLTDAAGMVWMSNAFRNLPLLRVKVLKRQACAVDASQAGLSIEQIRRDGLSGANRCGTAVVADTPGLLTVFVSGRKAGWMSRKKADRSADQVAPEQP